MYKGEGFFIDYRLKNDRVVTYRFLASNARDGLWVNPLLFDPGNEEFSAIITSIRFRCTDQRMVKDEVKLEWELVKLKGKKPVEDWFTGDTVLRGQTFSLVHKQQLIPEKYPQKIKGKAFSLSYQILLDTVWNDQTQQLKVEADLMFKMEENDAQQIMLVISLQNSQNDFWKSLPLKADQDLDEWDYAFLQAALTAKKHSSGLLSVYVWNNGDGTVVLDDFQVRLKANLP